MSAHHHPRQTATNAHPPAREHPPPSSTNDDECPLITHPTSTLTKRKGTPAIGGHIASTTTEDDYDEQRGRTTMPNNNKWR
ncbi:hypothetical protein K443DRAFT_9862 [Laccaria amethystina LaAM-08-1]|uniref:Uncharacterized protein n=1 Tax=Laccaria amethystina LaAM-08-1 TaxID=1095629 RepID=A0A0C9XNF6_9AGAR|nr:hypothetical protein K443DRAFT_9862 [Laccaria amethystina LaAM-08-1]